jgi:hypothetical protein
MWRNRGDRVEIMTLRVNGIISPASAAGHVVLGSNLTAWDIRGTQPCSQMPGPCPPHAVRAENPVHGSDQQSCPANRLAMMITDHVPAVRLPPDHTASRVAAAVPARGGMEDRRDLGLAPPARRAATAAARRPNLNWADRALLTTLLSVIPKARRQGLRLLVTPDTILRWHRDIVRTLGIASHWPFESWGRFLPEHTTAVSLLDRLLHHANVVVTNGDSYRMRQARAKGGTTLNKT